MHSSLDSSGISQKAMDSQVHLYSDYFCGFVILRNLHPYSVVGLK